MDGSGWTKISNEIIHDANLSLAARMLFVTIKSHCFNRDNCNVTNDQLAESLGLSRRQVVRTVKELIKYGLVEVQTQPHGRGNNYRLCCDVHVTPKKPRIVANVTPAVTPMSHLLYNIKKKFLKK